MLWMMMRCDCAREDRVVVFRDVCGDACIRQSHWCRGRDGACIGVGEEQHAAASVGGECRGDDGVCDVWCVVLWMMMRCDWAREDRVVVFRDV